MTNEQIKEVLRKRGLNELAESLDQIECFDSDTSVREFMDSAKELRVIFTKHAESDKLLNVYSFDVENKNVGEHLGEAEVSDFFGEREVDLTGLQAAIINGSMKDNYAHVPSRTVAILDDRYGFIRCAQESIKEAIKFDDKKGVAKQSAERRLASVTAKLESLKKAGEAEIGREIE